MSKHNQYFSDKYKNYSILSHQKDSTLITFTASNGTTNNMYENKWGQLKAVFATNQKLFGLGSFGLATIIGGPLATVCLMYLNYRCVNDRNSSRKILYIGLPLCLLFSLIMALIHHTSLSLILLLITTIALLAILCAQYYQGEYLRAHILTGGQMQSYGRTCLIGLFSLLIGTLTTFVFIPLILL